MKEYWHRYNFIFFIFAITIAWILILYIGWILSLRIPIHNGFLGPIPWANFDGAHYLIISKFSYGSFQQAYFPLFPLLISIIRPFFLNRFDGGLFIVYLSTLVSIFLYIKLATLDYSKREVLWSFLLFLLFPSSFFFVSIYPGSLFLALSLGAFYAMRKNKFFIASLLAGLASGTKVFGICLVFAIFIEYFIFKKKNNVSSFKIFRNFFGLAVISLSGLFIYMIYLWKVYKDPLLFIHVQPAFGAHRTGGNIILLPQVIFRYIKIFLTVPYASHDFLIALLEFICLGFAFVIMLFFWKRMRISYLIYSLLIIILPTLTGTLSSMPRYVMVAFPIFFLLGIIRPLWIRLALVVIFGSLLIVLTALFLRGYFIA